MDEYPPKALEEIASICLEEWEKLFTDSQKIVFVQPGKCIAFFSESFSAKMEEKANSFLRTFKDKGKN
jgi:hypothetical protein